MKSVQHMEVRLLHLPFSLAEADSIRVLAELHRRTERRHGRLSIGSLEWCQLQIQLKKCLQLDTPPYRATGVSEVKVEL
jgi:hypothetical protein